MIAIDLEAVFTEPPEVVFDFLADARNELEWNPRVPHVVGAREARDPA
jgi:hypothetical protein